MALRPEKAELIIGIVARIGVDTKLMVSTLKKILTEYNYNVIEIKSTDAIVEFDIYKNIRNNSTEKRYTKLISACDTIREKTKMADIMARLSVGRIIQERKSSSTGGTNVSRTAYIINQLKREEESKFLRSLYGEQYVQIAGHAKVGVRVQRLSDLIAQDNPQKPKASEWTVSALSLVKRDEAEDDLKWGQRVRDVFPSSDVIINAENYKTILPALDRFFRVLFGDPRVTPSPVEYGMQLARTASLRSSDLSRQVGASIMNEFQEVQALGCNEVPKARGGTYWEGDVRDSREFQLGKDSNDERKFEVLDDLLVRLIQSGVIDKKYGDHAALKRALRDHSDVLIKDSQLMDSLEYGRTVHAEMNAITDAARGGKSVRNAILYCNTFPCHNCAKHTVAAGLSKVIYLIPYPKSYAEDLFSDSIIVDPETESNDKVIFEQFIGILGPMYGRVFEKTKWKSSDGAVLPFVKKTSTFVTKTPAPAYAEAEAIYVSQLAEVFDNSKLEFRTKDTE